MVTTNLNSIVNNMILKRGYSKHWYLEFMLYARECLRELALDDLTIVNSKIIPVNCQDNTFEIPSDYVDYVVVGVRNGQVLVPLVESDGVDTLQNYNSDWETVEWTAGDIDVQTLPANQLLGWGPFGFGQWFTTHYNNWGEPTGRFYGGVGYYDTFKVLKKANKIKLNEGLTFRDAVLVYISNGDNADAVSTVDTYATQTILQYILYQFKENNRTYTDSQTQIAKNEYIAERQKLRARLSDLSLSKLKRIVHRTTIASPKN